MSELTERIYQKANLSFGKEVPGSVTLILDQFEEIIQEVIEEEKTTARDEIRELVTGLHRTELGARLGITFGQNGYEYLTWEELLNRVSLLKGRASVSPRRPNYFHD